MRNIFVGSWKLGSVLCIAGVLSMTASTAVAGEVDGKGNPIPGGEKGRSECSYSGQQDDPIADAGFFKGDRVQSWGQIPKWLRDFLVSIGELPEPGYACNPKKSSD
jgi:hypothetical protein